MSSMFIRNHTGHIIEINAQKFINEKEFYKHLWQVMYNITIEEPSFTERLVKYIRGDTFSV